MGPFLPGGDSHSLQLLVLGEGSGRDGSDGVLFQASGKQSRGRVNSPSTTHHSALAEGLKDRMVSPVTWDTLWVKEAR